MPTFKATQQTSTRSKLTSTRSKLTMGKKEKDFAICSKLPMEITERRHDFIANCEHISQLFLLFLLWTLKR